MQQRLIKLNLILVTLLTCGCAPKIENSQSAIVTPAAVHFHRGSTAYIVAKPAGCLEKRIIARLTNYLEKVLGKPPAVVQSLGSVPTSESAIILVGKDVPSPVRIAVPAETDESFTLLTTKANGRELVIAAGNTDKGLKRAVQRLIIKSLQQTDALVIPELNLSESPWIRYREWTIAPWSPHSVRGMFYNPYADKRMNIYLYDDKRLSEYVEMFDWFGFSGCQLIEACYTYSVFGSIEAAQQWQKTIIKNLRENGQQASLWTWVAEFTAHGWVDTDIVYTPKEGKTAFEDPDVRRSFEKYYDHFANLAPYIDRFFAHFFDPGRLHNYDDVYNYMHLLESKLKAKNPNIELGIDGWAKGGKYLLDWQGKGFDDYTFLTMSIPHFFTPGEREWLFAEAGKLDMKLGIWGWYTAEYETDQMASMYVNAQLLQKLYLELQNGALKIHPIQYWSEMEAHHLNDIYTMYASGQLLWNPQRPWREILEEFVCGIWGPVNGQKVLSALELIQDVRSGPSWDTYWCWLPTHRVGTADANDDLRRADNALARLEGLDVDSGFVSKFPLPFPPKTFIELMIPHIKQIRLYSEFRLKVAALEKAAAEGASKETLEKMLTDAWQPVPEFNTWVGVFGAQEIREQKKIVADLRNKYNLTAKDPLWLRYLEADRILQRFRVIQSSLKGPLTLSPAEATAEFNWPMENSLDRFQKLISDGVVEKAAPDRYQLTDWQNWALQ